MSMHWYEVRITLAPPLLSQRSGAVPFGLDAAMTVDPHGNPALPGSLVRGHLRENWMLMGYGGCRKWLGKSQIPGSDRSSGDGRGKLHFSPWWYPDGKIVNALRHRVRHDSESDAAAGQMLQISEVLDTEDNSPIVLKGRIFFLEPPDNPTIEAVRKGLLMTAAMGGNKGIGFGEVLDAEVSEAPRPAVLAHAGQEMNDAFRNRIRKAREVAMSIEPLWPFCFPEEQNSTSNRLVSTEIIPGSAVKAVMARVADTQIAHIKNLFDRMSVTHALPVSADRSCRPLYPPLSLAIVEDRLYDLAHRPGAGLISGEVPAYQPDWKDEQRQAVRERLGWSAPRHLMSIHNRHSSESRAAENEQLFSREDILPEEGQRWLCNIRIPKDIEDEEVDSFIDVLQQIVREQNFGPLGKTGTPAAVRLYPKCWHFSHPPLPVNRNEPVVICLQSPARLLNTREIAEIPATGGGKQLQECYARAWAEISEGSLRLRHCYVLHSFKGGAFWWERYGRKTMKSYETQVFTQAGSVFVLDMVDPASARKRLGEWSRLGLPQRKGVDDDYDNNPWIRENGWGEITLDSSLHAAWAVPEHEWEEIPLHGEEP